jgi:Fe-S-cluster containining protein
MYLGDYIVIEKQLGEFIFACESVSTGTPFMAIIDEDKRKIFSDYSFPDSHPSACRFLRPDGNLIRCTIHRDSPHQCKHYRCIAMLIRGKDGRLLGKVTGDLSLHSDDPVLRGVWERAEREIAYSDPDAEEKFSGYLLQEGYSIL